MKYTEALNKRAADADGGNEAKAPSTDALERVSPGEIGWGVAGAGGGALLGYTLARLLHRKPGTRTKLLYALLGAAAGAGGSQLALRNLPGSDGFDGSKLDEMRITNVNPNAPLPAPSADAPASSKPAWLSARNTAALAGLVGAVRGARVGSGKGGVLNPNTYETVQWLLRRDRATLEAQLNGGITSGRTPLSRVLDTGRYHGYVPEVNPATNLITLTDPERNLARGAVNAATGAALHAGAGYLAHKGIEKLIDRYSQNIDASNAAASAQELIARAAGQ